MTTEPIVHIVDDDEAVRNAVAFLLKAEGLSAEQYSSAQDFLDRARTETAGCILLDVRMPGMSGLELLRILGKCEIKLPVVVMTGHGDIKMAVEAMKAGAVDFVEKPFDNRQLLDIVRQCLLQSGEQLQADLQRAEATEQLAQLTPREREIMDLLVAGKLNKIIAADLDISVRTVEAHRARIMEKLQARSLSDIVRIALSV